MFGTYCRLGVSIWASNREVIRKARLKIEKASRNDPEMRENRKMFYREMLRYHEGEQAMAAKLRL